MKAEFVNSFLIPARDTWRMALGHTLTLDSYCLDTNVTTTEDITAVIRLSGELQGNVLYGFSLETAKSVASVVTGIGNVDLREAGLSALGDLISGITTRASVYLRERGYSPQILSPFLIHNKGARFDPKSKKKEVEQVRVVFHSGLGILNVRIGITEPWSKSSDLAWLKMNMSMDSR